MSGLPLISPAQIKVSRHVTNVFASFGTNNHITMREGIYHNINVLTFFVQPEGEVFNI